MLPEILMSINRIRFRQEFCDAVGIARQNFPNLKNGHQHFTVTHIQKACMAYGVNANWILGIQKNIFNDDLSNSKLSSLATLLKSEDIKPILNKPAAGKSRSNKTQTK